MLRSIAVAVLCILAPGAARAQSSAQPQPGPPGVPPYFCEQALAAKVKHLVATYRAAEDWHVGLIVGVVTPVCEGLYYFGHRTVGQPEPPDAATAFRIGSLTKVFTGTLLAHYADGGCVQVPACLGTPFMPLGGWPSTTLQALLHTFAPGSYDLKSPRDQITLEELADHHSGLSRKPTRDVSSNHELYQSVARHGADLPGNEPQTATRWAGACPAAATCAQPVTPNDRYCGWGANTTFYPSQPPLTVDIYSNWAFGVLGNALADGCGGGASWASLVRAIISTPLGMTHSFVDGESTGGASKAPAYKGCDSGTNHSGCAVDDVPFPTVANPAGGLWSTGPDMLAFLRFVMGFGATPATQSLYDLRAISQCPHAGKTGFAWTQSAFAGDIKIAKDGAYSGFYSYLAYLQTKQLGVFVLSNSNADPKGGVTRIADDLLHNL